MDHRIYVRGVSFRTEQVARVKVGDLAQFSPEPTNEHDPNAVRVLTFSGGDWQHVGYVPKELAETVRSLLDEGEVWNPYVAEVRPANVETGKGASVKVVFKSNHDMARQSALPTAVPETATV
jgi:hypothetical protein